MRFSEFRQLQLNPVQNVFGFVCEDDFLVEESRPVWQRIFGVTWVFDKYAVKEFEEMPAGRLMDEALTPSLFKQSRVLIVTNAERLTKARIDDLAALQKVPNSSLKVVLTTPSRKTVDVWSKLFFVIEIDLLRSAEVARWLVERYKLSPAVARYLVDSAGTDLYQLHTEVEKLRTYAADRPIDERDIDVLILRSERFGPFELDDAVLARDYKKAVRVMAAMLDDGLDPLIALSRIVRIWRQLFVGKALVGKRSAKDVAAAVQVPAWKAADFAASCKSFDWKQLAVGFRLLLYADRAFKTSTPNPEGYLDVLLWKLIA